MRTTKLTIHDWAVTLQYDYDDECVWVQFERPGESLHARVDFEASGLLSNWTRDEKKMWSQVLAIAEWKQLAGTAVGETVEITAEDVFDSV